MLTKKASSSRSLRLKSMAIGPNEELAITGWRDVEIVDRLGGGDAFAGGFIAGYLEDSENLTRAVTLGQAASAVKHTMPETERTHAEIEAAAIADDVGVLQR